MQVIVRQFTAAFAALFVSFAPAMGAPLKPTKPWVLDYAEAQCIASREYGDLTFGVRPAPNGETYEFLVLDQRPGPYYAAEFKGNVDFGRGPIAAWGLVFRAQANKARIYQFRISAAEMEQARSAASVRLSAKNELDQTYALNSMPQLISGFKKCTENLEHYWNMTLAESGKFARHARGDLRSLFTSQDYPTEAMDRSQEGSVQFLLLVNDKGRVAGCHVLVASGVPALDAQGCYILMERAHFRPAQDVSGKAIRDAVTTPPINWKIAS